MRYIGIVESFQIVLSTACRFASHTSAVVPLASVPPGRDVQVANANTTTATKVQNISAMVPPKQCADGIKEPSQAHMHRCCYHTCTGETWHQTERHAQCVTNAKTSVIWPITLKRYKLSWLSCDLYLQCQRQDALWSRSSW